VIVANAPLEGNCGFTPPGQSAGIYISNLAWNRTRCAPGCLTSTLYHELLHTVIGPDEARVETLENKCVGDFCKGTGGAPIRPDRLQVAEGCG
jgi:hypothetical protein